MAKAPYSALTSIVTAGNDNDNVTIGVLKEVIAEVAVSVTDTAARTALYPNPVGDEKVFNKATGNIERYSSVTRTWISDVVGSLTPQLFGAKGDGQMVTDAVMSSGANILTSATGGFTVNDVGKVLAIGGAGAAGITLLTTITGYTDTNTITLAANSSGNITAKVAMWGSDDTVALQNAIDAAITANRKLLIPLGSYVTTGPLYAMRFSVGAYSAVQFDFQGERASWATSDTGKIFQKSTRIMALHNDTFALGVQFAIASRIRDVAFIGQNYFYPNISTSRIELATNTTFVTNGCRDSRYSPYSGICIDPFGTAAPPDGGYPNLSARYVNQSFMASQVLQFESVSVTGFTVGFMLTPNATTSNDSEVSWKDCTLSYNKVGIASGQSQSRNMHWFGGTNAFALYCFDGNSYGAQQGASPKIYGCNMSGAKYLFNAGCRWDSALYATGIHAESFYSIGFWGSVAANERAPAYFGGCEFDFSWPAGSAARLHADRHYYAFGNTHFDSCNFRNAGPAATIVYRFVRDSNIQFLFTNCSWNREKQAEWTFGPSTNSGTFIADAIYFDSCTLLDAGGRGASGNVVRISRQHFVNAETAMNGHVTPFMAEVRLNSGGTVTDRNWVGPSESLYRIDHGTLTVSVLTLGQASCTVPDGTVVRTGDLVYTYTAMNVEKFDGTITDSMPLLCLGVVSNVNGNVITFDGVPWSLVDQASLDIRTFWWPRYHQGSTGDTSTSTSIANVTNPTAWKIGNKIRGSGIPTGVYITNIVGSTFTISKATTTTLVGTRLFDADVYKITGTAV